MAEIAPALQVILDSQDGQWRASGELLSERMGIVFGETDPHRMVATMPVTGNRQPYGLLHGGASAVLAETVGSMAAMLNAGPGNVAMGVELNCTHHRVATDGDVTAVCTPLHVGRTMSSFEIVVRDFLGRRICTARLTCIVRPTVKSASNTAATSETGIE